MLCLQEQNAVRIAALEAELASSKNEMLSAQAEAADAAAEQTAEVSFCGMMLFQVLLLPAC